MDIVDFNQCLFYLGLASQSKSTLESLLPYGAGLAGVVVGFAMNMVREKLKDKAANTKKMLCIDEDIHRLRHLFKVTTVELIEILCVLHEKGRPSGANIPSSFKAPLLEEFFSDVATKYDVQARYHLKELIANTDKLDRDVALLFDMQPGFDMSIKLLSLIQSCTYGILNCNGFYNEPQQKSTNELLKALDVEPSKIRIYEHMVLNAENHNSLEL